jgi:hypothetical protein
MIGMLLLLFLVIIGALMGLYFIGAQNSAPIIDTYGNSTSTATNLTQSTIQNVTSTGLTVGGGIVILVALIIGTVILLALAALAMKKI